VFLLYAVGSLSLWLAGTAVRPALSAASRVGILLPVGRRFAALAISLVLVAGVVRAGTAQGSVGPPSNRMVQMVADTSVAGTPSVLTVGHRPMATSRHATHTVEPGDSLWKIASEFLSGEGGSPTGRDISDLWRSIYDLNRDLIGDDPNLILPGQVLRLPAR